MSNTDKRDRRRGRGDRTRIGTVPRSHAPASSQATWLEPPVLVGAAVILLLVALAYWPSLNGDFILDDDWYLTRSLLIKDAGGLYRFWFSADALDYYPVSNSSLWLEWRLWGLNPTGYRLTNLLLHVFTAGLLWALLRRLRLPGAFLAAVLFAVHPVNVESVAWVAQRKEMLAAVFFLASLLSFLEAEIGAERASPRWYAAALAAFVLAILSKSSVAILPLVLLGMMAWLRPLERRDLVRVAPFVVVSAVLLPMQAWFQTRVTSEDAQLGGAIERLLGAAGAVWFYLYKALVPLDLCFIYPRWQVDPASAGWWLPLIAVAAMTVVLWRRRRGWQRALLFAWGYFCVALLPVMGFTSFGFREHSLVADHYQHLALIGVLVLVAGGWDAWRTHWPAQAGIAQATAVVAILGLAFLTWRHAVVFGDAETLYRDTVAKNPGSWLAHNNLGFTILATDRNQEAVEEFELASRLKPSSFDVHTNLAQVLLRLDRAHEAVEHYRTALALRPENWATEYDLAVALVRDGRLDEALASYRRVLESKPDHAEANNNLGGVLLELGRPQEAREHFVRAIEIDPDLGPAHINLGRVHFTNGEIDAAVKSLRRGVELEPESAEAHNDLGAALAGAGQRDAAIEQFREALRLNPNDAGAKSNLEETLGGR